MDRPKNMTHPIMAMCRGIIRIKAKNTMIHFYLESHRSVLGSYLYVGMKLISPSMKSVKALFVCL